MRVFFLTSHKILVKTEVPRLRALGYEVFQPPYRGRSLEHQSLTRAWDHDQPTTLPPAVFNELASYNFYFNEISPRVARLLNEHFDAVIVASDPAWLVEVLKVFHKKVLFRAYGQVVVLSEWLWAVDALRAVVERDDFWFIPHAPEAVLLEHDWLKARMEIVPYVPSVGALAIKDTWRLDEPHDAEIMATCPNIGGNAYYRDHYRYLKANFPAAHFRYYGVQTTAVDDPQVVGTLADADYFQRYARVSGLLYTHRQPTVCFLPPIEMMLAGGPVIFLDGSLLSRCLPADAPGGARNEREANEKCRALLHGDGAFARSVIASQQSLRDRFLPEHVWPRFDETFRRVLASSNAGHAVVTRTQRSPRRVVYAIAHRRRDPVRFHEGRYSCNDGRMHALRAIVEKTRADYDVIITCRKRHVPNWYGFFEAQRGGVRFFCVDDALPLTPRRTVFSARRLPRLAQRVVGRAWRELRRASALVSNPHALIATVNADPACAFVILDDQGLGPHLKKPIVAVGADA